mmetsp:Transcript_24709/g.58809  ORF Transcript_24709/g.58809 Transcript_24709/m.58809 type:complete len:213 (-) Transcript_24709:1162-1800(-)
MALEAALAAPGGAPAADMGTGAQRAALPGKDRRRRRHARQRGVPWARGAVRRDRHLRGEDTLIPLCEAEEIQADPPRGRIRCRHKRRLWGPHLRRVLRRRGDPIPRERLHEGEGVGRGSGEPPARLGLRADALQDEPWGGAALHRPAVLDPSHRAPALLGPGRALRAPLHGLRLLLGGVVGHFPLDPGRRGSGLALAGGGRSALRPGLARVP